MGVKHGRGPPPRPPPFQMKYTKGVNLISIHIEKQPLGGSCGCWIIGRQSSGKRKKKKLLTGSEFFF
jgi:hypothetical protein